MALAIVIDAERRDLHYVDLPNPPESLPFMKEIIGGWISCAHFWRGSGDVLYMDDDGLLKEPKYFFRLTDYGAQPLAGNGIVVGEEITDDDGDWVGYADIKMKIGWLRQRIQFLTKEQAVAWFRGNASEPMIAVTATTIDGDVTTEVIATFDSLYPKDK
jgi:hypothetical protein